MAPSSPLVVKMVGMERRQLSWQRGYWIPVFSKSCHGHFTSTKKEYWRLEGGDFSLPEAVWTQHVVFLAGSSTA
jgi:hypothetical protein